MISTFPEAKKKLAIASTTRDGIRIRAIGGVICGVWEVARPPRGDLAGGWCQKTPLTVPRRGTPHAATTTRHKTDAATKRATRARTHSRRRERSTINGA